MSVLLAFLFFAISTIYSVLNGFLFLIVNLSNKNRRECLIYLTETNKQRKNFSFSATEDRSQDLNFDCPTLYQDLTSHSAYYIILTYVCQHNYIFSHYCFVPGQLYFLVVVIKSVLSVSLVAYCCLSVSF